MPIVQYFDRTGRALSKREAFEADGKTLRDGIRCRVPATMRDAAPRFADGRSFWDAHRDALLVTDARAVGGVEGCRPGFRIFDSDVGRAAKEAAYAAHEWYLNNAYRDAATAGAYPYSAAAEGASCTVDGRPCKPLAADGKPPRPEDEDDENGDDEDEETATADARSVDQIARDHAVAMERIYAARNLEISDAWRAGKGNK